MDELALLVFFGMPEHAEHERAGRVLDRLHGVVLGPARHDQALPHLPDPLVVVRLYGRPLRPGGAGGEGVWGERHLVVGEGTRGMTVLLVTEHLGEVLLQ